MIGLVVSSPEFVVWKAVFNIFLLHDSIEFGTSVGRGLFVAFKPSFKHVYFVGRGGFFKPFDDAGAFLWVTHFSYFRFG